MGRARGGQALDHAVEGAAETLELGLLRIAEGTLEGFRFELVSTLSGAISLGGESDPDAAAILRVGVASHQPATLESIEGAGHAGPGLPHETGELAGGIGDATAQNSDHLFLDLGHVEFGEGVFEEPAVQARDGCEPTAEGDQPAVTARGCRRDTVLDVVEVLLELLGEVGGGQVGLLAHTQDSCSRN